MSDIDQILKDLKYQYHRVLIINEENSEEYKDFCRKNNIPLIDLSEKLSELISDLPIEEREMEAWDKLKDWLDSVKGDIVAFYNIDYVFSPEVGIIDPVKEFSYYSRSKKIVILFIKAKKKNNLLMYSEEGNQDYKEMDISNNQGFVLGW